LDGRAQTKAKGMFNHKSKNNTPFAVLPNAEGSFRSTAKKAARELAEK